jgi:hypothetical protein
MFFDSKKAVVLITEIVLSLILAEPLIIENAILSSFQAVDYTRF